MIIIKIKTKSQTHEVTNIRENTPKSFIAIYKDFEISVQKEPRRNNTYYIMCTAPSGSYIYDGYFYGTRLQAIKEVFEEIELCMECMNYCPKCNIIMENDDFYYDEEREEYMEIWICPQCGYREDIPE